VAFVVVAATIALVAPSTGHARQCPATTFPLLVNFDPTGLDDATVRVYQNVLNGFTGLPAGRAAFFSGYSADNGFLIGGWSSLIASVQQNCNGYLVTLNVAPGMSSNSGTDCVINDLIYSEIYQVNNDGTFNYVSSLDPNNQSGLVSNSIDGY
jgi:hypothetical protein